MNIEDELLRGAIDLHAHSWPEFSLKMRGRMDDIEWARAAQAAGMRAYVMKSHVSPPRHRLTWSAKPSLE